MAVEEKAHTEERKPERLSFFSLTMQNLIASPHLKTTTSPLKSTSISTISTGESYVLGLASLNGNYAAMSSGSQSDSSSSSAPSGSKKKTVNGDISTCPIHIYAKQTLQKIQSLPGHEVASTFMRSVNSIAGLNGPTLVSSGKDGSVRAWDERSGSHGIKSEFDSLALLLL